MHKGPFVRQNGDMLKGTDTKGKGQTFSGSYELIRFFLRGSIGLFFISMLFSAAVSFLDMLLPRIISFTVDSVIDTKAPDLPAPLLALLVRIGGVERLRAEPLLIGAAVACTALLAALFRFLTRYENEAAAQRFVKRMRDCLFRKIEHLPYAWHGMNSSGDIVQRCTSDVETIKVFVSEQLTQLIRVVVLIAMAFLFMSRISAGMTLAASVYVPVVIGYSLFFYRRIGSAFGKADAEEGRLSAIAQENLTGVRVVRAFGREMYERKRFEEQNEYYTHFWINLIRILTWNWIAGDVMMLLQSLLITIMGTVFTIGGRITAGQFIAFVSYNAMLVWPVRSLGRVISEMSKADISLDRLRYIMNAEEEVSAGKQLRPPMDGEICFHHVSFSYEGDAAEALHDVSFSVPAGGTVGILGGTGSGKSTLMYLLEKLYPLKEGQGRITIGGVDIADIDTDYLRGHIGMVLQEPYLFSRSLSDNILIAADESFAGNGGTGKAELIRDASRTAALTETIERFPSGLDTFVGERGVTLSGGQKQRTAIAQMLARRCPVMIFDDSLSAVDAETDARIRRALTKDTECATVILIAHRIATLMHADRIIVLSGGEVREAGTHAELLARGGIYSEIFALQLGAGEEGTHADGKT